MDQSLTGGTRAAELAECTVSQRATQPGRPLGWSIGYLYGEYIQLELKAVVAAGRIWLCLMQADTTGQHFGHCPGLALQEGHYYSSIHGRGPPQKVERLKTTYG